MALSKDIYLLTFSAAGIAFLAGLLCGSEMSLTTYARNLFSKYSFLSSRHASASKTGRATHFHAQRIVLVPSLWTSSIKWASLATLAFPGLYYIDTV